MPKVSVCIPSYNLGYCIAETIESVRAQSFTDWELLIEDDGSTDDSREVLARYAADQRITVTLKTENEGQNRTTNNLVRRARGEYVALLPADDVWEPEKLAKQVAHLDAHPEVGIAFGIPAFMDDAGGVVKYADDTPTALQNHPREWWQRRFIIGNCVFIATSMYRRTLHEALGEFDESYHMLADLDWYLRVVKDHEVYFERSVLARVRVRSRSENLSMPTPRNREIHADEIRRLREKHNPVTRGKTKYMIATPFYDVKGFSPYIGSLVETLVGLARYSKVDFCYEPLSGDSYVWRARNILADRFLKSDCSHLLFIDSDHGWEADGFVRLLKADKDFVGCVYPVKNNWEHFGCTIHVDSQDYPIVENETGLIRAEKVPTGFLKLSRRVFERIRENEPENWYWDRDEFDTQNKTHDFFGHITEDHIKYGEDISFGRRWIAAGGEIWIQPFATIEHWGTQCWKGNYAEYMMARPGGAKSDSHVPASERAITKATEAAETRLGVA